MTERELEEVVLRALNQLDVPIAARQRLIYAAGKAERSFQVDVLIGDKEAPLVVIELKSNGVSTHDLITYGAKARLHRSILTHLRYGIFVSGDSSHGITPKWFWHGDAFDFLISCRQQEPSEHELAGLREIVTAEVETSKQLRAFLTGSRPAQRPNLFWRGELRAFD